MKGYEDEGKQQMRQMYVKANTNIPESIDEILEMQYNY